MWDFHADGNWQWHFLIFLGLRWPIRSYNKHSHMFFDIILVTLKATGRTVPLVTSLPSSCYMTQNYSRDFCRPGRPTTRQYSTPNVFGGKTGGWLPLVTAYVAGYQTSPRLTASTQTHHNRADAHYFQVLELLQPYNALGCLLSRVFWILTCCWVQRQLPL